MPPFFNNLKDKFKDLQKSEFFTKRNIIVAITLLVLALALIPGIKLIQDSQILRSRAEGEQCKAEGGFEEYEDGRKYKCEDDGIALKPTWDVEDEGQGCSIFLQLHSSKGVADHRFTTACSYGGGLRPKLTDFEGGKVTLWVNNGTDTDTTSCHQGAHKILDEIEVDCSPPIAPPPPIVQCGSSTPCAVDSSVPICDVDSKTCRACRSTDNCGGNLTCTNGKCVAATATCVINGKQDPTIGDQCAACIVTANSTLPGGIKAGISDSQCPAAEKDRATNTQLLNYWCNGGISTGGSSDCLTKKAVCGVACGATPVFSPSPRPPTPSPSPSLIANNATCGTFTAPGTVLSGRPFSVTLTMNNPTGAKAWNTTSLYRLGKVDTSTNNGWILPEVNNDRVSLPSSPINAGSSANFSFQVTAPQTTGDKSLVLRMVQDGVEWFGGTCTKLINITSAAISPSPSPSSSSPSPSSSTSLNCDFNKDGKYDDLDFKIWVDEFTRQKTSLKADCNTDLKVDLVDFNLWRNEKINRE